MGEERIKSNEDLSEEHEPLSDEPLSPEELEHVVGGMNHEFEAKH